MTLICVRVSLCAHMHSCHFWLSSMTSDCTYTITFPPKTIVLGILLLDQDSNVSALLTPIAHLAVQCG